MNENNKIPPTGHGSGSGRLSEEKLMAYLEGKLSPAEQRQVELWLSEEGMESDAVEGLQAMPPAQRAQSVARLDHNLRRRLGGRRRKRKEAIPGFLLLVISVIVILLLVALAYAVTKYAM